MSAAVCFRPDGTEAALVFGMQPGSCNDQSITEFLLERLPPYAYNPVEQVWGNLKGTELANLCPDTIGEVAEIVDKGLCRIGIETRLAFAFLRHCRLKL